MSIRWPILALDPASRKTGYAVIDAGADFRGRCVDAGLLTLPAKKPVQERLQLLERDVLDLVQEHRPGVVVVEVPSGKCGTGSRHGASSSLIIYGQAVQAVVTLLRIAPLPVDQGRPQIVFYNEREWTRGTSKHLRQIAAAGLVKGYDPLHDRGGDTSDAIMLGMYHVRRAAMEADADAAFISGGAA